MTKDEQITHIIEFIAEGVPPRKIKERCIKLGFETDYNEINRIKRDYHSVISQYADEQWRQLAVKTGLGRRAQRMELRQDLIQRMYELLVPDEDMKGFETAAYPLLKQLEEMLRGIAMENRDEFNERNPKKIDLNLNGGFDPSKLTDEQLRSMWEEAKRNEDAGNQGND